MNDMDDHPVTPLVNMASVHVASVLEAFVHMSSKPYMASVHAA